LGQSADPLRNAKQKTFFLHSSQRALIFLFVTTTANQDPADRFAPLLGELRRISDAHGPGHGIAAPLLVLFRALITCMIGLFARLAEQARAAKFSEIVPAPSPSASAAEGVAPADLPADEVHPRERVEPLHAGVSGVRAQAAPDARGQASGRGGGAGAIRENGFEGATRTCVENVTIPK
jgi:hypothetical protein